MSGKRRADNQVTRENLHDFENDGGESTPSGPSLASAEVLAKRKILKPRSRLNRTAGANGNGSAPSSGFSFKPTTDNNENGDKPANPFGAFGGFGASTNTSTKPAFSFGQKSNDDETEKPKTNAFQFLNKKPETQEAEKPKSTVFSFLNNSNNNSNSSTPAETSLTRHTSTDLVSSKEQQKPNKIKALNDNFYDKITEQRQADPVSNFTPILRKYIDYYEKIENDLDYLPDADADTQPQEQQQLEQPEQKSLPAPAPTFSFGQPTSSEKPALSFGNNSSIAPSFNFGATTKPAESDRTEKEPTPMDETKDTTNNDDKQVIDVSDSDSDSDSDDDIKVEGPKFTLAKPPTTTDSVFKLDSTTASKPQSNSTGPSFTFAADSSKKFNSPFTFAVPEKKEEPVKEIAPATEESKSNGANFSWSPDKPIKFGSADTSEKKDEAPAKPTFSFGVPAASTDKEAAPKPVFSFGIKSDAAETNTDSSKPSFSFGSSETKTDASKPTFSFGLKTDSSDNKSSEPAKPTFSFGANSALPSKPAFSFGGDSSSSTAKPSFGFGQSSSTFNFSFSGNKDSPAPATTSSTSNGANNDDDKAPEEEPDTNFKPVVQLTEKIEDKTGEEDEATLYTKRSKLSLFVPGNKENPYESKGLGELKVLQHKETKKARILVRSDGANRVLLNSSINKSFKYDSIGNGNTVRIPVASAEGKIETYLARVKTPEDGANLLKALQDAQSQS